MHRRHADYADYRQRVQTLVESYADRVLDGAALQQGMTLVDVGAGDGLVAFRAIDRIGASLKVVLVDISLPRAVRHFSRCNASMHISRGLCRTPRWTERRLR